jgi:hypothetical protein
MHFDIFYTHVRNIDVLEITRIDFSLQILNIICGRFST